MANQANELEKLDRIINIFEKGAICFSIGLVIVIAASVLLFLLSIGGI